MIKIDRTSALILILLLALSSLSLFFVERTYGQSTTELSAPDLTARLIDNSYDVPVTHTIDPYSGQEITNPAHNVQNYTIQLSINNQPYENQYNLYYNIRVKGHFAENWDSPLYQYDASPLKTNSTYTFLNFIQGSSSYFYGPNHGYIHAPYGQLDFQAEAFVGGSVFVPPSDGTPIGSGWHFKVLEESNWSNTQTITIPETSASTSPSPNPTPTPTVPEFSWLIILPPSIVILSIAVIVKLRKTRNITQN
jgi:hypothetical protein